MTQEPRIVLTTGGTGGHIFPALAVAEALKQQCPEVRLLFVGSQYGPEAHLAVQAGLDFVGLPVRGVLGRGWQAVSALGLMGKAVFEARTLLKTFKPHVVAGFGAYASVAPLLAGALLRVPLTVHEQNAIPGVSNRLLAKLASRVFLSLPDAGNAFEPGKCLLTGNPVRQSIVEAGRRRQKKRAVGSGEGLLDTPRTLLVMGGSQGARAVNSVVLAGLARLLQAGVNIRHQAGSADFERVQGGYLAHGYDAAKVSAFIDDMPAAYEEADLVLCRAGATSVAELAAAGMPSVLVPFPFATHDHQTHNAQVLVKAGAARLVAEKDAAATDMTGMILDLLKDEATLQAMGQSAACCAHPDAAVVVARGILSLVRDTGQS